jgi:hypothetical protein
MQSITEFGREYIAISDGLHGADVPLQYDGTNLDRYTQDGPGDSPTVTNITYPPITLTNAATGTGTIATATPQGPYTQGGTTLYANMHIVLSGGFSAPDLAIGNVITVSGNSLYNFTGSVVSFTITGGGSFGSPVTVTMDLSFNAAASGTAGTGGTVTRSTAKMTRFNNVVTATTNSPSNLQVGYQVLIQGTTPTVVTGATWVIDNTNFPGIATITLPGTALNGIGPGETVYLGPSTIGAGTPWISTNDDLNTFTVVAAPAPNQFQIQVNSPSGSGTGLSVSFAWDGIFYVTSVTNFFNFTYNQQGPNDSYTATGGTETPKGQVSPGKHQLQVAYLRRQGGLTAPSPPFTFYANGDSYLSINNIPIASSNDVIGRVILFTGALGSLFYYIPIAATVNGQVVSTSTVINDNTTTSMIVDFSDNTLFAALACSIPGNNLAAQIVIDGSLGFSAYASRLNTWGQRNRVQSLLNMGFEGGYTFASQSNTPSGWVSDGNSVIIKQGTIGQGNNKPGACLVTSSLITGTVAHLYQPAYQDGYGAPILVPNTLYKIRGFFNYYGLAPAAGTSITFRIFSPTLGIISQTNPIIGPFTILGNWIESTFQNKTGLTIPTDAIFEFFVTNPAVGTNIGIDELSLIYAQSPYTDTIQNGSYVNNPEGLDGLTGVFGPADDNHKIMNNGIIRGNLYMLTRDPSGNLHETSDNGTTEPSGWTVNDVASDCGSLSAFCLTTSQGDDNSSSGGEEWFAWASESGARLFGGDQPWKISQEIQPNWRKRGSTVQINMQAATTIWSVNDPVDRVIYFGVPLGTATAPSAIYAVDYKELETAYAIANADPLRPYGGQIVTSDLVRKWSPWYRSMNGAARIYRVPGELTLTFFNGNGQKPGLAAGFGILYRLNPLLSTDDDYGQINSYYTTASLPSRSQELQLQLGPGLKMLTYLTASVSGIGNITITPLRNTLTNAWPYICTRLLSANPTFDLEWVGASVWCQRVFFRIQPVPVTGTDNRFTLNKLFPFFRRNKVGVRGSAY